MRLRTKITIGFLAGLTLVTIISITAYLTIGVQENQARAEERLKLICSSYGQQLETKIENYSRIVKEFGSSIIVSSYIPDFFREANRVYPEFESFFYSYEDGQVVDVYPYNKEWLGKDLSDKQFWNDAIESQQPSLSTITTEFGSAAIIVSAPVFSYFREQEAPLFHGVISASLPLETFTSHYEDFRLGATGELLAISAGGEIFYQTQNNHKYPKSIYDWKSYDRFSEVIPYLDGEHSGSITFKTGGRNVFFTFYPVPSTGWNIVILQDVDELRSDFRQTLLTIGAIFLISVLLAFVIISSVINRVTKPLNENLDMLKRMASGSTDLNSSFPLESADEIGEMTGYFKEIVGKLQNLANNLNIDLEKERVQKRKTEVALHRSERRFKAIFNQTYQFIWLLDLEGTILESNTTLLRFTNLEKDETTGVKFWDAPWWGRNTRLQHRIERHVQKASQGFLSRFDTDIHGAKEVYHLDFSLKPVRDEKGIVSLLVAEGRNITERKILESNLEKLVDERTRELREAQDSLIQKEKFSVLGQLTAVVSHELRNPLGTIRSSTYIIKNTLEEQDERIARTLDRIERNVIRCDNIIEELLDYTKESRINLQLENIDAWLSSFSKNYTDLAGIEFISNLNSGKSVMIDKEFFRRVLINLIDNAIQCFPNNTLKEKPQIELFTRNTIDGIEIGVKDNGPGISEENKHRIFEPLFSTKSFGVGLGLPTVVNLVKQHNGTLKLESKQGEGSTFIVSLSYNDGE